MWNEHFFLTFELKERLSEMTLINGDLEECQHLVNETISRSKTPAMKAKSMLIQVESC